MLTRRNLFSTIAAGFVGRKLPLPAAAAPPPYGYPAPWTIHHDWDFELQMVTTIARARLHDERGVLRTYLLGYKLTKADIVDRPDKCALMARELHRAMGDLVKCGRLPWRYEA